MKTEWNSLRGSYLTWACGFVMALSGGITSTPAQEQPTSEPANTVPASAPAEAAETVASEITPEIIQTRLTQTETATDLADPVKTEVVGLYKQAIEQLAVAENWAKQVARYQSGRDQAPDQLVLIKQRIEEASSRPATKPSSDLFSDMSSDELGNRFTQAQLELKNRQAEAQKLDDEAKTRMQRKALVPDLLGAAKQRQEKTVADLAAPPDPSVSPQLAQAQRSLLMAQKQALEQEIAAYEEELRFYDARTDLLAARRDEAKRLVYAAQAHKDALEAIVSDRRKTELEQQRQQTTLELQTAHRVVRELAQSNARLLEEREAIDEQIDQLEGKTKTITDLTERLSREFEFLQKNIDLEEGPDLGPLMRMSRDELVGLRSYEADLRTNKQKYAEIRLRLWEIEEEWLIPENARVKQIMEQLRGSKPQFNLERLEPRVRELAESHRTSLEQSKQFLGAYEKRLRQLIAMEEALTAKVREFHDFIEEHVFSVRSANPIHKTVFPRDWYKMERAFVGLKAGFWRDMKGHIPAYALAVAVLLLLVAGTPRLRRRLHDLSPRVARAYTDSYRLTLIAFFYTAMLSLPGTLILWFAAHRVTLAAGMLEGDAFNAGQATAAGLRSAMWIVLILAFGRNVCRPKGLADIHFRWDSSAVRLIRTNLLWLTPILSMTWFLVSSAERYLDSAWQESVGRLSFVIAMLSVAICAQRLLRPAGTVLAAQSRKARSGWLYGLRHLWYAVGTLVPLTLIAVSLLGYHYTAVVLARQSAYSLLLFLILIFTHAMMVRWVLVAQRRLALEQARQRRAAAEASGEQLTSDAAEADDVALDIGSIGDQTKTLLRSAAVLIALIGFWAIWNDMLPALGFLEKIELWPYTIQSSGMDSADKIMGDPVPQVRYVTLRNLLVALILTMATFVLAKNMPGLLEITILNRVPLDVGGRYAVTALVRYVITVVGIIIAFGAIGIGWSQVQWLVAAVTVGLGFGLQEIFANFVSGLMLLFERPIRVGDTITVGEVSGTVARIRIRATTITGWDRKELVIPNKEFITGQVVNWTLSDSTLRLILPVGIAYGSDTQLARDILYRIAREHPCVLADPEPKVLFMGFGDSSLDFELRIFIGDIDDYLQTRDELNNTIDQEFRKAKIEIAFPQRDLHLRSTDAGVASLGTKTAIQQATPSPKTQDDND